MICSRSSAKALISICAFAVGMMIFPSACRKKSGLVEESGGSGGGSDSIPFEKAGEADTSALAQVHAEAFASAPAPIRPDPDLYARRLLRQFRSDGNTLARQLGLVEQYRLMLGGATDDFRTVPQDSYDATSLLTLQAVAQEICIALVAPDPSVHFGWQSVLPEVPENVTANVRWLMRKMHAVPDASLSGSAVGELVEMVQADAVKGVIVAASYITACTAMAMDAEALLL